ERSGASEKSDLAPAPSTKRRGATLPPFSPAAKQKFRAAILPGGLRNWRSCRRKRARLRRLGSSARRRRSLRATRAGASPPTPSPGLTSDGDAHTRPALALLPPPEGEGAHRVRDPIVTRGLDPRVHHSS